MRDTRRYFFQCFTCKAKFAADVVRTSELSRFDQYAFSAAQLLVCPNGHLPERRYGAYHRVLGYVRTPFPWEQETREQLVTEGIASPCDGRCTNARGPDCECVCGGKNHGTQRLIAVQHKAGPVPQETS